MSFIARFFKQVPQEFEEKLKSDFDSLRKKSNSVFIGLVSLTGKSKGMDIISSVIDDCLYEPKEIKRMYGKLTEAYLRFNVLDLIKNETKSLRYIHYDYGEFHRYCIFPIPDNDGFIIIALTSSINKILSNMHKLEQTLSYLKSSGD